LLSTELSFFSRPQTHLLPTQERIDMVVEIFRRNNLCRRKLRIESHIFAGQEHKPHPLRLKLSTSLPAYFGFLDFTTKGEDQLKKQSRPALHPPAYPRVKQPKRGSTPAPHFQRRSHLHQPALPDVAIKRLVNWIHRNDRVRNEESRQNRQGVLLRLTALFTNPVIDFTENPHHLDSGGLFSFLHRISSVGPSNKTVKLRRVPLATESTFTIRELIHHVG